MKEWNQSGNCKEHHENIYFFLAACALSAMDACLQELSCSPKVPRAIRTKFGPSSIRASEPNLVRNAHSFWCHSWYELIFFHFYSRSIVLTNLWERHSNLQFYQSCLPFSPKDRGQFYSTIRSRSNQWTITKTLDHGITCVSSTANCTIGLSGNVGKIAAKAVTIKFCT